MKKVLFLSFALFAFLLACSEDKKEEAIPTVSAVEITEKNITLRVGDTHQFKADYAPKTAEPPTYNWSTNSDLANINGTGLFTALKEGTAKVLLTATATSADGAVKTFTDETTVTILPVDATGIILNAESLSLSKGETKKLTVSFVPANAKEKEIVWLSSDEKIVTVSDGTITALSAGEAVITAKTKEGDLSATCKITVAPVLVSSLKFTTSKVRLEEGETFQTELIISPENADNKNILYSSSWEIYCSVDNKGMIKGVKRGKSVITAKSEDGNASATMEVEVLSAEDLITAIHAGSSTSINYITTAIWDVYLRNGSSKSIILESVTMYNGRDTKITSVTVGKAIEPNSAISNRFEFQQIYAPYFIFNYIIDGKSKSLKYDPHKD